MTRVISISLAVPVSVTATLPSDSGSLAAIWAVIALSMTAVLGMMTSPSECEKSLGSVPSIAIIDLRLVALLRT